MKIYKGNKTERISFPLGGIGSGSVGMAGNGAFVDWEIFNRPFKNSANGFTHLMVRAEEEGKIRDVRALQGDYAGGAIGGETCNIKRGNGGFGYGYGIYRGTMAGVPHFSESVFAGEYPFASIRFADESFPGGVTLTAFNPFIPLNDRDSSLPAAFYEITFENTGEKAMDYTAYFSLNNLLPCGTTVNRFTDGADGCIRAICMTSDRLPGDDLIYGNFCLATDAEEVSCQEYWYRSEWFDSLQTFWNDVHKPGRLENRHYASDAGRAGEPELDGEDMATLAAHIHVLPGRKKSVRFCMSWYFPNCANYWNPVPDERERTTRSAGPSLKRQWKNYYAVLFESSYACAEYALLNWERLYEETAAFKNALYETTLPEECLEAVSANLSVLKSAACMRLEDGSFYGFEGCGPDSGCCEGSCSHVWNYAYALPYLFPSLERSMRDLEYAHSMREDGSVSFRLMLPLGRPRENFRACVDGQMGGVLKVYRDYKLCGSLEWLRGKWEAVKKSIEFAWAETNEDQWDADRDGVMEGRQHHTLDMELFGPNSWLNGFYLAALKAGSEIARLLGHEEEAAAWERMFRNGKEWTDRELFNGEYYQQRINLKDKRLLERYNEGVTLLGKDSVAAYWNEEEKEIKYQVADGCLLDQVIAGWHANLSGLGEIFDREQVKSALASVYRYNFKKSFRNEFNAGRIFCLNGEGGAKVCAWPDKVSKPSIPVTYSDEVMCGMEYQAACHMIQEGLAEQGFEIVRAVRARYDGGKRNPWSEIECGSNYARSMSSFALIPSVSGYVCDLGKGSLTFDPKLPERPFSAFYSMATGWGVFRLHEGGCELELLYGTLRLRELCLPFLTCGGVTLRMGAWGEKVKNDKGTIAFGRELLLIKGDRLGIRFDVLR